MATATATKGKVRTLATPKLPKLVTPAQPVQQPTGNAQPLGLTINAQMALATGRFCRTTSNTTAATPAPLPPTNNPTTISPAAFAALATVTTTKPAPAISGGIAAMAALYSQTPAPAAQQPTAQPAQAPVQQRVTVPQAPVTTPASCTQAPAQQLYNPGKAAFGGANRTAPNTTPTAIKNGGQGWVVPYTAKGSGPHGTQPGSITAAVSGWVIAAGAQGLSVQQVAQLRNCTNARGKLELNRNHLQALVKGGWCVLVNGQYISKCQLA